MHDLEKNNKRDYSLDFLRGIAICLIVLGHVLRGLNDANFKVLYFDFFDKLIYTFHLPLIFFLSGISQYRFGRLKKLKYFDYVKKNIISLYIPYLIFSYFFWFIKYFIFSGNSDTSLRDALFLPISGKWVFWFLISLLLIKIVFYIFEKDDKYNKYGLAFFVIIFIINIIFNIKIINWLSYGIYYSLGYLFEKKYNGNFHLELLCLIVSFLGIVLFKYLNLNLTQLFIGLPMACLVYIFSKKILLSNNIITKIGKHSMVVYLCHTLFSSIIRELLLIIGCSSIFINIIVSTIFSIAFSMLVVWTFNNIKLLKWIKYLFYPFSLLKGGVWDGK